MTIFKEGIAMRDYDEIDREVEYSRANAEAEMELEEEMLKERGEWDEDERDDI